MVARLVRDQKVAGSNPVTSTTKETLEKSRVFSFSKKHRSETGFEEAVMNEATVWPQNGADRRAVEALRIQSCHLDQKTAGNLRISGFFLCNLHKDVSLAPFP